jgi:hypothetical protein
MMLRSRPSALPARTPVQAWARVALICLTLLGLPGCLFIDEINRAPQVQLDVTFTPTGGLFRGYRQTSGQFQGILVNFVELEATASDPDDARRAAPGDFKYEWTVDGRDAATLTTFEQSGGANHVRVAFPQPGDHHVSVVAVDGRGARSPAAPYLITVTDAPPDPQIEVGQNRTACGDYLVGHGVDLLGSANDRDAQADPTLLYHWTVSAPGSASAGSAGFVEGPCPPTAASTGTSTLDLPKSSSTRQVPVCFVAQTPGVYTIQLQVGPQGSTDSTNVRVTQQMLLFGGDRPACADGFDPPVVPGATYVLGRTAPARFSVTEVLDDNDPFPATTRTRFTWSLWRESDPVWREVRDWSLPEYRLDPESFLVDELVRVRVMVQDSVTSRPAPSCDVGDDVCPLVRDYPNDVCYREPVRQSCQSWVTWNVRFR